MADWNLPSITGLYTSFRQHLSDRLDDVAKMFDSATTSATNLPEGTKRWSSSGSKWEKLVGAAWSDLAAIYNINISGNATTATTASECLGNAATATLAGTATSVANNSITTLSVQDSSITPAKLSSLSKMFFNVKHYGAKGDGVTNDTTAIQLAMAAIQVTGLYRGGVLYFPRGVYKITDQLVFNSASGTVSSGHNVIVRGDGPYATTLDFTEASAGTHGIVFQNGGNFGIEGLLISGAKYSGVFLGDLAGGSNYCFQWYIKNCQIKNCGRHGIESAHSYLGSVENCFITGNASSGIYMVGFHTSLNIIRCECGNNGGDGYTINGIVYSNFISCAADSNTYSGYSVQNANGIVFSGCGCESNQRDGWFFTTSTAGASLTLAETWDIRGVVMNGCVGLFNSLASAGTYGTFVRATTSDSRAMDIIINGGRACQNVSGNVAFILQAFSGAINLTHNNVNTDGMTSGVVSSGIVNQWYGLNGATIYEKDATTTDTVYNKTNYSSGATYYSDFRVGGDTKGYISYNGTNVIYSSASDYRLKEDIIPMVGAIERICRLKPSFYVWKNSGLSGEGFIAHELQEVCPGAVVGFKDELGPDGVPKYQGVDNSAVVPLIVAAIKEVCTRLDTLEEKIL